MIKLSFHTQKQEDGYYLRHYKVNGEAYFQVYAPLEDIRENHQNHKQEALKAYEEANAY